MEPNIYSQNPALFISMSEDNAISICEEHGLRHRVVQRDENFFIITMDMRLDRVNFHIENGRITGANIG